MLRAKNASIPLLSVGMLPRIPKGEELDHNYVKGARREQIR